MRLTALRSRILTLIAASLALVLALGLPTAHGDEYPPGYPKLADKMTDFQQGYKAKLEGISPPRTIETMVFTIHTSGTNSAIRAYCIELTVRVVPGTSLRIGGWDDFPGTNQFASNPEVRRKVAWIVANSWPENDLASVAARSGVTGLDEKEVITATQAAIWHFTDNTKLTGIAAESDIDGSDPRSQRVMKLYSYLISDANLGLDESSGPSLKVTAPTEPSAANVPVGPFRIESSAPTATISGAPYPIVDAKGTVVDPAAVPTGVDLFLDVPDDAADGSAVMKVTVAGSRYSGKLLLSTDPRSQTIIITDYQNVTLDSEFTLSWKAVPPPSPTPTPSTTPPSTTPPPSVPPTTPTPSTPVGKPTPPAKPRPPKTGA